MQRRPEGTFKVGVVKVEYKINENAVDDEGNPIKPTEEQMKHPELLDVRLVSMTSLVPDEYTNPQTSPIEITLAKDVKEVTVELPAK